MSAQNKHAYDIITGVIIGVAVAVAIGGIVGAIVQSTEAEQPTAPQTIHPQAVASATATDPRPWNYAYANHHNTVVIGEGLSSTAPYQFVVQDGRCTISHDEWEVLVRLIQRIGANNREQEQKGTNQR